MLENSVEIEILKYESEVVLRTMKQIREVINKDEILVTSYFDWFGLLTVISTIEIKRNSFDKMLKELKQLN